MNQNGRKVWVVFYASPEFGLPEKRYYVRIDAVPHSEYCHKLKRKLRAAHKR